MLTDYGRDLSCTSDLDESMSETSGNLGVAQALARRVSTPRGALIDDPNYGTDITDYLNDTMTPGQLARVASAMDAEFLKDQRVQSSTTTATFLAGVLTTATLIVGANGPFTLVLAISDVTVSILRVTP